MAQQRERTMGVSVQFLCVVDVYHHDHRLCCTGQRVEQNTGCALWQDHWQPGVDADAADVRYCSNTVEQGGKCVVRKGQRVATGQDDFRQGMIGADYFDGFMQRAGRMVCVRKLTAKAVATMNRAGGTGDKEGTVSVLLNQSRGAGPVDLIHRIGDKSRHDQAFIHIGEYLQQQRVAVIAGLHSSHKRGRDSNRKVGRRICVSNISNRHTKLPQQRLARPNSTFQEQAPGVGLPRSRIHGYHARLFLQQRYQLMATYSTNEFKSGIKVMLEGDPCSILDNEYVKPGKGQAFNRVKLRNLKTGRVWERTFKSGDSLDGADVMEAEMEYLYNDGEFYHFMKTDGSFEQFAASENLVADAKEWLREQDKFQVILWNDQPISIAAPNFVELEVVRCDPGLKGDTATGATKPATLSSGAVVRVPLFVNEGDVLRVDTRNREYVSRVR